MKRPTGITLLAFLEFYKMPIYFVIGKNLLSFAFLGVNVGIILLATMILHFVVAVGLWFMKKWAYRAILVLTTLLIIAGFYDAFVILTRFRILPIDPKFFELLNILEYFLLFLFADKFLGWRIAHIILGVIPSPIVLFYLTRSRIKDVFRITVFLR